MQIWVKFAKVVVFYGAITILTLKLILLLQGIVKLPSNNIILKSIETDFSDLLLWLQKDQKRTLMFFMNFKELNILFDGAI